jgi:serine/threonine protein kinase/tetratricopeptide (TPR) repeat protein
MNAAEDHRTTSAASLDDPRVGAALREYLAALENDEPLDRAAFLTRHADIAAALSECLEGLDFVHSAARSGSAHGSHSLDGLVQAGTPLGDFRIVREVGRGGMGVVYEAEQLSLSRRVALKVLPFAVTMDPRHLQRFQNEARAAACLQHPQIVPVYAVGCERGVHYYAMQFIDGQSLASLIDQQRADSVSEGPRSPRSAPRQEGEAEAPRPLETEVPAQTERAPTTAHFRRAAQWGIQAAEALEHAHSLGIVHRDVKPANLMIDGLGALWVTDFGLARTAADAGLTMTGDVIGTLRYMSPEQALAKHGLVDHRTDVYSLGATLYELVTGTPAIEGTDRQEILHRIAFQDVVPPRQREPRIPLDLETILLKALAIEPAARYASAQDLADDLRRFVEDRPIRARRPSLLGVGVRWTRRHQGAVLAAMGMLLVLTAVLAVSVVLLVREKAKTNEALRRADAKNRWARRAVNDMYSRVAEQWLAHEPHMTEVQKRFLQQALDFYEELAAEESADPDERLERAVAFRRMGDIRGGGWHRSEGAEANYRQAVAVCAALTDEFPDHADYRAELGRCRRALGKLLADHEQLEEGEKELLAALSLLKANAGGSGSSMEALGDLGDAQEYLSELWLQMGKTRQAAEALAESVRLRKQLAESLPGSAAAKEKLAFGYLCQGEFLANLRQLPEAADALGKALDLFDHDLDASTVTPWLRSTLGGGGNNTLADVLLDLHRPEEAAETVGRALAIRRRVNGDFPNMPYCWHGLAMTYCNQGRILIHRGRREEARDSFAEAVRFQEKAAADNPQHLGLRQNLALLYADLAWFDLLGPVPERDAREALRLAQKATELIPDLPAYWTVVGVAHYRLGDWANATACLERAVQLNDRTDQPLRGWVADTGILKRMAERQARTALALNWFFLAMCQSRRGLKDEAAKSYERALQRWEAQQIDEPSHAAELQATRCEAAELLGLPRPAGALKAGGG